MISIDTIAVENEVADNMYERSELDWLIYNLGQLLLFCGPFLQKALHWLSRRCFGVFLVHHLAITLVIVPVLVNHRVTPLYWVSGLLLLTVGSFVISFLLDGLSRSIIKFLAESVVT